MPKTNAFRDPSAKAASIVASAILLGCISTALTASGTGEFGIGLAFFLLTLVLCTVGIATGRFRIFWWSWGVASVSFFLLFGMATPVAMVLALPRLVSAFM